MFILSPPISPSQIKIGIWDDSENLLPYVAADADATKRSQITGTVCFGAEFYVSHELKTVFLQIRTLVRFIIHLT